MGVKEPEPTLWYVKSEQPVVIGYATSPAAILTVNQLNLQTEPPVEVTCKTNRVSKREELYWLTAVIGKGTVWFEWTPPGATEPQRILVHADDERDTVKSRAEDAARIRRCQTIWRLMVRTNQPQEVVERVLEAAGNSLGQATHAFRLYDSLRASHPDEERVRTAIEELQGCHAKDRRVTSVLAQIGANNADERATADILRGALLVVGRRR